MFKNTNSFQKQMKKRGIGHHLDWIIGISLFMLYLVFLIVTLKPGIQPLHKGDTLLSIIQDRFITNVTWNVTRIPLSVTSHCGVTSKGFIKIQFPFSGWINSKTKMVDDSGIPLSQFDISPSGLMFTNIFIEPLPSTKKFYLSNSIELNGNGNSITSSSLCLDTDLTYVYGIPELITGLSKSKIDGLKDNANTDYEKLKSNLNYPITNDFIITGKGEGINFEIKKVEPPQNVNVYVRQFPEFILDSTGERIPITLTISVW